MTDNFALHLIFFVYGLAFFAMGLAIALESRRASTLPLARSLKYLAAFGIVHSAVEWIDMFMLTQAQPDPASDATAWRVSKVVLLAISSVCLLLFAGQVLAATRRKHLWLRYLPGALFLVWILSFVLPHVGWTVGQPVESASTCLQCHWGESEAYLSLSGEWWTAADNWARYLLYLPGSLLAALAIDSQRTIFRVMRAPRRLSVYCRWAAAAFLLNAVVAGLVVTPGPYFPASVVNYATFFDLVHVPPQVIRAALAVVIAYSVVRVLRVFEIEQRRQLELANRERFEAQQASLDAEQRAHEEIDSWNRQLEGIVQQRTSELEALYTIGMEISALLDLDRILENVVESARNLLKAEVATISLFDEHSEELAVRAVAGTRTEAFRNIRMRVGRGVAGRAVADGKSVAVSDYRIDATITHELDALVEAEGLSCHVAVPLTVAERPVGALYVADRGDRTFGESDVRLLARFANQASIAIENARLYVKVQNLAVLEERDRLAREMHDSVAQSLGFLSLKASVVGDLLAKGDGERAATEISVMERVADDAYADVRESILGLRSAVSSRGLIPTLTEYLRKFGLQNHINTHLAVEDGTSVAFAPAVEVQIVRIIQEALTNVRKHANAKLVTVGFGSEGDFVIVSIKDDGRGFDVSKVNATPCEHFGLQTMRERAGSVGAGFEVRTAPANGTEIVVRLHR